MAEEHVYGYNPTVGVDSDSVRNSTLTVWQVQVGIWAIDKGATDGRVLLSGTAVYYHSVFFHSTKRIRRYMWRIPISSVCRDDNDGNRNSTRKNISPWC